MGVGIAPAIALAWLDGLGNASNWTAPTAVWIKLHLGDPGAAGTSNPAVETTRQQASFSAAASAAITTDANLIWTSVAATETYAYWSAWTANVAGTFIMSDNFATPIPVTIGSPFTILAGDLDIVLTGVAS